MGSLRKLIGLRNDRMMFTVNGKEMQSLIRSAIGLYEEYITTHDHSQEKATDLAILEALEDFHHNFQLDVKGVPIAECQGCGAYWPEIALLGIKDLHERVAPGEPMPSGECPLCRSLCQRLEE